MTFDNAPKSKYVYSSLSDEKTNLQNSIQSSNENIGIAQTVVEDYTIPCAALDQVIVNKIVQINTKKQQIVTLLSNNRDSYLNNTGGCLIGSINSDFPSSSINVVVPNTITTFPYTISGFPPVVGVGISAEVREESVYGWCLPVLETQNTSAYSYDQGAVYRPITSSNLGVGKTDWLYMDTYDPNNVYSSSATLIGYYTPIKTGCASIVNQVNTLTNDIVSIRSEINALIPSINALKNKKTEKEMLLWFESISKQQSIDNLNDVNSAISVMDAQESTITAYEQST